MSISPIPGRTTAPIPAATMLGYLAEGARTNLCLQSNAFTTTWIVANTATGSIVQNVIGPDGGTTAWTLTDTDATAMHGVDISVGVLTAASYTFSVFIKKTSGATTYPVLLVYGVGSLWALATIDTNNGVATLWSAYTGRTIVGTAARCTSFNADFWRAELVFTGSAVSYNVELLEAATETANKSTGTLSEVSLTGSAVFYGAQVELGSFASSYIATTTAAVTRNADVLTYSGGDIPNLKTLTATFRRESGVSAASEVLALSDNTLNNTVVMQMDNATLVRSYGVAGGVTQWNQTASNSYTAGSDSKVAVTFATNDVKSFFAGTSMTADTSATVPVVTRLEVGMVTSLYQLYGTTKGIYGWTRNLSQSELNAVTR